MRVGADSYQLSSLIFVCVGVVYSGEYDVCDVTLSVYPHRVSLKNMPGHGAHIQRSHFRLIFNVRDFSSPLYVGLTTALKRCRHPLKTY